MTSQESQLSASDVADFQFPSYEPKLLDTLLINVLVDGQERWETYVVYDEGANQQKFKAVSISDLDVQEFAKDALQSDPGEIRRAPTEATSTEKNAAVFMRAVQVYHGCGSETFRYKDEGLQMNGYTIVNSYEDRDTTRDFRIYKVGDKDIKAKGLASLPGLFFQPNSALHDAASVIAPPRGRAGGSASACKETPARSKRRSSGRASFITPPTSVASPLQPPPPSLPDLTQADVLEMTNKAGEAEEKVKRLTEQRSTMEAEIRAELNNASGDSFDEAMASGNKRRRDHKEAIDAAEADHKRKQNKASAAAELREAQVESISKKKAAEEARLAVETAEREEEEAKQKISQAFAKYQAA